MADQRERDSLDEVELIMAEEEANESHRNRTGLALLGILALIIVVMIVKFVITH